MLEQAGIPGSDDWWLMRLGEKLGAGLPRMRKLTAYRDGDALLPDNAWDTGTRESYMRFMRRSRLHTVETIRDARTDRQRVLGFRTAAPADETGDLEAFKHWRGNRMGVQSRQFFNDTGDYGRAYILTIPGPDGPIWNVRNEWNTITEQNALRPWLTEAGITYGYDQINKAESLTLWRPGYYRRAYRLTEFPTLPQDGTPWYTGPGWTWREDRQITPWTLDALLQQNRTVDGFGVYEKHLDTVDRINEITLNALTLIVMQSFRQRGVKGNLPTHFPEGHPQAGHEIDYDEMFKAGPAALWMLPLGAEIWESASTDVTPVYSARKEELKTLMSNTRTPQDLFDGESNNQSAKGADISREPLIHAVQGMNEQAEVALTQAMSQSFLMTGDTTRASITDLEVIWGKIQPSSLAEKAEAAAKFKTGGATQAFIDEEVFEMTPAQMRQAAQDRLAEAFVTSLGQAGQAGGGD
ncbi:hypothetical protein [Microbacterium sp. No. 7]|uniref:hypothetical protein n=1 Tax=Microbacterium sp. No. 7 TaxID=1714373 RepID=UPI0006ED397F|nr:hypothetical protein [Microbacterium sp. No. 7]ALJ22050.1 hypothetical protein AOA12_20010 [Microbacterium sp. No. 7]